MASKTFYCVIYNNKIVIVIEICISVIDDVMLYMREQWLK